MTDSLRDHLVYYSEKEEWANRLTHGAGALFSLIGLVVLIVAASTNGDVWCVVSVTVFGSLMTAFYVISTLYHTFRAPRLRYLFRILDHAGIYLVIAGTYTPFTLVSLRGAWGWSLFGTVWGLAIGGVIFKAFMTHRLQILAPVFYIAMGWIAVIAFKPLLTVLTPAGMGWLLAGGVAYTGGIIFYAWDRIPYNHAIWHLFVLLGSSCHYFSVLWYVLPQ
ncbi:MAG: hemolysin III family protein [Desulfuromonadaceae bacterium]